MQCVIATHNAKKAGEMMHILSARFPTWRFTTLADFPGAPEPEETGSTYAENARIKAESAAQFTGCLSIADDAGLEVDAMNGEPGLFSKRFGGDSTTFLVKMGLILDALQGIEGPHRAARFRSAVCVALPEESGVKTFDFEATCEGQIAQEQSGAGGFGYDPIFFLPTLEVTMADLTAEQKHAISHRGKVLKQVGDWLATRFP